MSGGYAFRSKLHPKDTQVLLVFAGGLIAIPSMDDGTSEVDQLDRQLDE